MSEADWVGEIVWESFLGCTYASSSSSKSIRVCSYPAVVAPIVHKVDDELDAILLCLLDDHIEALKTIGASVYR